MSAVLPRPNADTLYAADDGMVAPLSSQECMIQNPRTQERHVIPSRSSRRWTSARVLARWTIT